MSSQSAGATSSADGGRTGPQNSHFFRNSYCRALLVHCHVVILCFIEAAWPRHQCFKCLKKSSLRVLFCVQELYAKILLHIFYCGPS